MRKIKILETIRQGNIGGGESHVLDLVAGLNKDLFEPVVLSFTPGPMIDRLNEQGIKTYVIETETPFNFRVWGKVKKILKEENISLLHAHGTRANSNTFYSAKQLDIPIIYTVHGWSFHADQKPLIKKIRTTSEKFLVRKSNMTICVSDSNLKEGQQYFSMPNATVIKNGINQKRFNPNNEFKNVRAELGIASNTVVVGFIARITAQKDPLTLIQAIAKVPENLDVKFLIVGDGDLKEPMLQLAKTLEVADRIIFQNFRQDVPDVLHAMDIYCLPSLWEGLSIALLEAMAMKKAIIATAVDGTKEVITDGENGLFVPVQHPDALALAITKLVQDKSLRDQLAAQAQHTIAVAFNTEDMVKKVERIYTDILAKNNSGK